MKLLIYVPHTFVGAGAPRRDFLDRSVDVAGRKMGMAQSIVQGVNVIGMEELLAFLVKPDPILAVLHCVDTQALRPRDFEYEGAELRLCHIGPPAHVYRVNHSSENCFA
ncbi:hypothetical protein [Burkholderia diffusa]|uniref:hypothetical protein n=1 Tax=Burkholderia diffusa TaxID=488732 RepID=UPI001583A017|nr:hypothetical protein [Burkholderia diffusa]